MPDKQTNYPQISFIHPVLQLQHTQKKRMELNTMEWFEIKKKGEYRILKDYFMFHPLISFWMLSCLAPA